ncbi:uncharacterized protein [Littorina saxatilis]|uniref:Uncharacterized protein n=1 Tax=Littorina saxatilis TaxID=31220 RepID=A0AAN9GBK5_9CAEN
MGTGSNCSYTNTTGVLVNLQCAAGQCCDTAKHQCAASFCDSSSSDDDIKSYLFWFILAGSSLFTVFTLVVSYAVCRYRKPGCADAGAARDRFLEENILAHTLHRARTIVSSPVSPTSTTPATASPAGGHSPDLLVRNKPTGVRQSGRSMIPIKKPAPLAVNRAFIMGAEAFARKPITVQRGTTTTTTATAASAVVGAAGAGVGVGMTRSIPRPVGLQRSLECDASGAASPRMVQLGGLMNTPRGMLREKGRTESKQTIISSDTDSLTAVGT